MGRVGTGVYRRAAVITTAVLLVFGVLSARILIIQTLNFERYQKKVSSR